MIKARYLEERLHACTSARTHRDPHMGIKGPGAFVNGHDTVNKLRTAQLRVRTISGGDVIAVSA